MVDDPQRDSASFDSSFGGGSEIPDEDDINALLDGASALAAELAEDIGDPDADAMLAQADRSLEQDGDAADQIAEQLSEMDQLMDDVDVDLGSDDEPETDAADGAVEAVDEPLPDSEEDEDPAPAIEAEPEAQAEVIEEPPTKEVESIAPVEEDLSTAASDGTEIEPAAEAAPPAPKAAAEPIVEEPASEAEEEPAAQEEDPFTNDVEAALAEAERLAAQVAQEEPTVEEAPAQSPPPANDSMLDAFLDDSPDESPPSADETGPGLTAAEQAIAEDPEPAQEEAGGDRDDLDFSAAADDLADLPSFDDDSGDQPGAKPVEEPRAAKQSLGVGDADAGPIVDKPASKLQKAASKAALAGCSLGAVVLEKADKPFGKINTRFKRIAGWLALATLATAFVIFIITLF